MNLHVIGLSHREAEVAKREYAFRKIAALPGVVLATCNRVENYFVLDNKNIINEDNFYLKNGAEAVRHLFRVASGLESQILGETEILGQVKNAANDIKKKYEFIRNLFQRAVVVGRKVRVETEISRGNVSVASAAVRKAELLCCDIYLEKILLVGCGPVIKAVLKNLIKKEHAFVLVANRTFSKARELAGRFGGKAIHFMDMPAEIADTDLIISATKAPHLVLRKESIGRRKKQLIAIDLGVPRDIDPAIAGLAGVRLFDIDYINEEITNNLLNRQKAVKCAERIVNQEVEVFCKEYELEPAAAVWL